MISRIGRIFVVLAMLAGLAVALPGAANAAPARYAAYYYYFDTGKSWIPYHDTRWVPQGLTKWGENNLVIAYYDRYHRMNSIIAVIDRVSGRYVKTLHLDSKSHVGGLAMTSKYLWVASDSHLRRYARSAMSSGSGSTIYAQKYSPVRGKASYAFAEGETVWVGTWNPSHRDWMYQYRVNSGGTLSYLQDRYTPSNVQGVALTGSRIIWSQSAGRDNDSKLIVWPRALPYTGSNGLGTFLTAPNMSEGLVIAGGQLQVVYESGSDVYNGTADGNAADYIIRSVHHGRIPALPNPR